MARIGGRDTKPEMLFRRALRSHGIGYRLHARDLPGRPDVVFRGARLAVFVHGCFWHRHPGCARATHPKSSIPFWSSKFAANVARDRRSVERLRAAGWRVGLVWECEVEREGDRELAVEAVLEALGRTSKFQDVVDLAVDGTERRRHSCAIMKNVSTSSSTSSTTL